MNLLNSFALISLAYAQNPFKNVQYYVNPSYQAELDSSIVTASGSVKTTLQAMRNVASAYWIDTKSKILGNSTDTLQGILQDSLSKGAPLVTVILYDLPNRDCNARASNGEICCSYNADRTCDYSAAGDCAAGLNEYETTYVNPFAQVLAQFDGRVPIVVIVEPDSLPNLATNQGNPSCGNSATVAAYTKGISYAVTTIKAKAPHASVYLDAAHGGWLGWDNNLVAYADLVCFPALHSLDRT